MSNTTSEKSPWIDDWHNPGGVKDTPVKELGRKGMDAGKAFGGHARSYPADLTLVQELAGSGHNCRPSCTLRVQVNAFKAQLRENRGLEMLNIEEALASLEQMTEVLSVEDFICISQKCRKTKNLAYAKRLHMHICKDGLEGHRALGNHLVPMFVECGSISDAQQVFDRLANQNEYSWTSLIQGYTACGELWHALDLFQKMQENHMHPSKYTFVALLKACARLKCMKAGQEIHAEIAKEGLERDPFIGNTLVHMYTKCDSLAEAQEVFGELPVQDIVSWNALITGYAEQGPGEEVLRCLEQMVLEGIAPNPVTLVCSLKACGSIGAIDRGREIHTEIVKEGFERGHFVCSSLVNMYAKCGSLAETQNVFDRLPAPDVVSWTALISGYANHGLGEEALTCLEQMQLEGVSPDAVTFVYCLKACGSIGAIDRGREIHFEMVKTGLERDPFVGNSLVDMYAELSLLAEAQGVFDKLLVQNVGSWNTLISGYAEHGLDEDVLNCLEQLQHEGVSPNAATFVCCLKACGSIEDIDTGREIYAGIAKEGFESDRFVCSTLVHMYAECGSIAEAHEVFGDVPIRGTVLWNVLITAYAEHGHGQEALDCLEEMQLEGMSANDVTFICSLKACGSIGAVERGQEIHAEIAKEGFERDPLIGSTLVHTYAKCGWLAEAQDVFDDLPTQDVVLWNALMAGYIEHGFGEEALNCLEQMQLEGVSPDVITFANSLKACGCIGAIDRGQEIHAGIAKEGFQSDPIIGNTLVHMYAKCGLVTRAREVFDELPVHDVVSWTALIAGYTEHERCEEALKCLEQMQLEGVSPNVLTFVYSLKACGSSGALDKGREIHAEIARKGFERDPSVGGTLVYLYSKCGLLAEAREVFDDLPIRGVVLWNMLLTGYAESGHGEEALNCLEQMQLEGVFPDVVSWTVVISGYVEQRENENAFKLYAQMQEHGLSPDSVTFLSIMKACGNTAALETGKKIHAQIYQAGGLEATEVILANALIGMYGKCGSMVDAQKVFDEMPLRDPVTWTALIAGYSRQGETEIVFHLFARMREDGIPPDGITFLSILNVCCHAGLMDKGHIYFEAMSKEYGINPSIAHYNSMIDLLGRSGQLDEAVVLLKTMPFQPDRIVWMTLLDACRKWNNVALGKLAFDCVVQLDENYAAAYILMSSIYADAHMLEDVKKIEAMRVNIQEQRARKELD